jgi:hypothetical protein
MAARLGAALADVDGPGSDGKALDTRTVYQRVKSARLLKDNAYAFCHLAAGAVEDALRLELGRLLPQAATQAPSGPLGLVPLEEIDERLALAALARPFDIAHAEALAALAVRLGLLLGRGVLRYDANPFRPAVFLQAIEAAWRAFEPDASAHGLARPLLTLDVVFDLGPLFDALAARLQEVHRPGRGGYHIQKTDGAAAAQAARAGRQAALTAQLRALFGDAAPDADTALVPDLPDMPAGSGGWRPSAAAGFQPAASGVPVHAAGTSAHAAGASAHAAGASMQAPGAGVAVVPAAGVVATKAAPAPAGASLLAQLAAATAAFAPVAPGAAVPAQKAAPHNVFYLPRLKQGLPAGSLAPADERTLDLLSRVFETVLLDDSIPPQARELLQLLQAPVLKAALLDRNFFFEQTHPARRLVDLLSRMGWERRIDGSDPVFQAMRRGVHAVGAAARGSEDASAGGAAFAGAFAKSFATAVADLEARIEAGREAEESALQAAIAGPVASALARERQETATRAAREAVALRVDGAGVPDVVGGFLEQRWTTVMTFAYSIEDARPGAVEDATRAMDDLVWSVKPKPTQEQRKSLIARLPRLLAALNKWLDAVKWQDAARLQFFAALAECHAAIVRAPLELSPERQLELAVEAARQDALRRVELEQATREQEAARAAAFSPLEGLERGTWLEFRGADGARKARLAWASPLRTLFIFSGPDRGAAFSLPADKLAAALHAGSARVLALDGVVGQVLAEAMREGAVNDAHAPALQA